MHNHNITAPQRVLYVSGMLLAIHDILDKNGNIIQRGLIPEDLLVAKTNTKRDGILITNQIEEYLKAKQIYDDGWNIGELVYPLGRGINFSIAVYDIEELYQLVNNLNIELYRELTRNIYQVNEIEEM